MLLACTLLACRGQPPMPPPGLATPLSSPADDRGQACADVGTLRACWTGATAAVLVPRPVPAAAPASPMGWRCGWPAQARVCVDRRADAPAFACAGERCTQTHARRPDDGEWTCVDSGGATVCVGGVAAAGVVAGPRDPAWVCGDRKGQKDDHLGKRVCVDLAPDFPHGDGTRWRCRQASGGGNGRVCERANDPGVLGAACDGPRPCLDGAVCAGGRCVPARPAPSCWLDDDCPGGACRFGSCREEGQP